MITRLSSDQVVLAELGQRLARLRLGRNLTQAELAAQAGVSKRTVERLESGGEGTRLAALIRVCRALEVLDRLEGVFPEAVASPMDQVRLAGRQRRRASGTKAPEAKRSKDLKGGGWTWDEKK